VAIAHDFEYHRPQTLNEALELKARYREQAMVLTGGTDLIVNIKEGMIKPDAVIDIKDIHELNFMESNDNELSIGSLVTFSQLIDSKAVQEKFVMLWDAAKTVASAGVRSRATLAGNICSAVPSLDSAPPLLCYNAVVHAISSEGKRDIPIQEWFLSPRKTALRVDEIVTGISLFASTEKNASVYLKLGRYGGEDLAQAGWGILITESMQYRIAHCALAPIPKRGLLIEQLLNGNELSDSLIREAMNLVDSEISPIADIRSSKEYRVHMSKVMLKRGLIAAGDRLNGLKVDPARLLGGYL
jgi:CO/xanthine dehydrogenase FAD-binding subunit